MTLKLQLCSVSKSYIDSSQPAGFVAVSNVTVDVEAGEFICILGPSGCGKSSLLNMIAGFESASSGTIALDGKLVEGASADRTMVFQDYALFPWKTIAQNVEFGLKAKGISRGERQKIAGRFIELVGLKGFEHRYPHQVSGGMKQRAAVARALAHDPDVILMDEPFGALDQQTRDLLQEEILRVWTANRKTIVLVTHSIDEAVFLSDRVIVMTARPGRIKQIVTIPLDRPRRADTRNSPKFLGLRADLWESIRDESEKQRAHG
jgi:NitT/TauT family transport system ATP-binding protein